jgi:hypothetical protein
MFNLLFEDGQQTIPQPGDKFTYFKNEKMMGYFRADSPLYFGTHENPVGADRMWITLNHLLSFLSGLAIGSGLVPKEIETNDLVIVWEMVRA